MNLDVLKSNRLLINSLKNNLSLSDESELERRLGQMNSHEVFERFLNWNNIIGYGNKLWNVYETLEKSLINDKLNFEKLSEEDESGNVLETLRLRGEFSDDIYENPDAVPFIKYIEKMSLEEAFSEYVAWNGILGFSEAITRAIQTIKKAKA